MTRTGEYKKCKICGKEFYALPSRIKIGKGFLCSRECADAHYKKYYVHSKKARLKISNRNFKHGLIDGNPSVYMPHGIHRKKHSRIPIAWLKIELKLKRKLKSTEVIHHKDGNKLNNRISNLVLCKNQAEHAKLHSLTRKRNKKGQFK
ncbi:MAG: HNH endonuclease [Candidatus Omnitrophota bacterium]